MRGFYYLFQHTAARRRLGCVRDGGGQGGRVSTHSRPKAAGLSAQLKANPTKSFNTQPPEGGWATADLPMPPLPCFNTQPPEGGWDANSNGINDSWEFQHTAARRRLVMRIHRGSSIKSGFNTQPPEGGWALPSIFVEPYSVSTHSRPKAAGVRPCFRHLQYIVSTHSRPKAAGSRIL